MFEQPWVRLPARHLTRHFLSFGRMRHCQERCSTESLVVWQLEVHQRVWLDLKHESPLCNYGVSCSCLWTYIRWFSKLTKTQQRRFTIWPRAIVFMLALLRLECFDECTYETLECLSLLNLRQACHLSVKPSDSRHFVLSSRHTSRKRIQGLSERLQLVGAVTLTSSSDVL